MPAPADRATWVFDANADHDVNNGCSILDDFALEVCDLLEGYGLLERKLLPDEHGEGMVRVSTRRLEDLLFALSAGLEDRDEETFARVNAGIDAIIRDRGPKWS